MVCRPSPSAPASSSCSRTAISSPRAPARTSPCTCTSDPGSSTRARWRWLNQTALTAPVSSTTCAVTIRRLRRRVGRSRTDSTRPRTVATSPGCRSAIALVGGAVVAIGTRGRLEEISRGGESAPGERWSRASGHLEGDVEHRAVGRSPRSRPGARFEAKRIGHLGARQLILTARARDRAVPCPEAAPRPPAAPPRPR